MGVQGEVLNDGKLSDIASHRMCRHMKAISRGAAVVAAWLYTHIDKNYEKLTLICCAENT